MKTTPPKYLRVLDKDHDIILRYDKTEIDYLYQIIHINKSINWNIGEEYIISFHNLIIWMKRKEIIELTKEEVMLEVL